MAVSILAMLDTWMTHNRPGNTFTVPPGLRSLRTGMRTYQISPVA